MGGDDCIHRRSRRGSVVRGGCKGEERRDEEGTEMPGAARSSSVVPRREWR
jgi:hypothetical protein